MSDCDHNTIPMSACECCLRQQQPDEPGWVIDPVEGCDFCPECAASLREHYVKALVAASEAVCEATFNASGSPLREPVLAAVKQLRRALNGET